MWSYWIVDTLSGDKQLELSVGKGPWARRISDITDGTHTFQMRGSGIPKSIWRPLITKWARTLVISWNGVAMYDGLIIDHRFNRKSGRLTLTTSSLRLVLTRRHAFAIGTYGSGTLSVTGKSLTGLVQAIVAAGAYRSPADPWHLPIVYPGDEAGSHSRTYYNYMFQKIDDMLADIESVDGGPDIDFEPRWNSAGQREYLLRVGTPRLTGGVFEFPMNVPKPVLFDVDEIEKGRDVLTGVFAIGKGSEADKRHGEGGHLAGTVVPYLDTTRSFTDVDDVAQLNSHAMGELRASREPITQWDMKILATSYPGADQLRLGSTLRLEFRGDEWEDDGWRNMYLLGIAGDGTRKLTLEVQEI